jgi:cytolysin-activating lysine-acyltransferase
VSWRPSSMCIRTRSSASVIGNFKQVVKDGELRMHPLIGRLVDKDVLEKLGASRNEAKE